MHALVSRTRRGCGVAPQLPACWGFVEQLCRLGGLKKGQQDSNRDLMHWIVRNDTGNGSALLGKIKDQNPGKSQLQQQPETPDTVKAKQ